MTNEKKDEIKGLGDFNKLTVQKSNPLFSLWWSNLSLAEFKILDTYLARIDSHNPQKRIVIFRKGELERLLGVKQIRRDVLDRRLTNLMKPINIEIHRGGIGKIVLFELADAQQDANGYWRVFLKCTESAMQYFFNIENLGYIRYKLQCITSITSRYSYVLFNYLEINRFRGTWEIGLCDLKDILNCHDSVYNEYKYFNKYILKNAQKDLFKNANYGFTYTPVKNKKRYVIAIRFKMERMSGFVDPEFKDERAAEEEILVEAHEIKSWEEAVSDFSLTETQIAELQEYLPSVPDRLLLSRSNTDKMEDRFCNYMKTKVAEVKRRDAIRPIKNKYAYLLTLIKKDVQSKENTAGVSDQPIEEKLAMTKSAKAYNSYSQRKYSKEEIDALERRLLTQKM